MADPLSMRRPKLAYPFTILTEPNTVRLVAGEDYRYTFSADGIDAWLPALIRRFAGTEYIESLIAGLPTDRRETALQIITHLFGERVLVDASAADAHVACSHNVTVLGQGKLRERLAVCIAPSVNAACTLTVLCQDRLDYEAAIAECRRRRSDGTPLLWVSYGALSRAYVSPLFLADAGPCFECLLRSFQRLSPAPEIYDALRAHARQQRAIEAVDFPEEGLLVLQGLVLWKLREVERADPDPALYRLHVLERERFEVTTHRVFRDPSCEGCS